MPAARAQAQAASSEVIITGDAVSSDAFDILRSALDGDGIALARAAAAPQCIGTLTSREPQVRAWVSWLAGGAAQLCFQDHCRSLSRTLGPYAKLDARAREELITVLESSLTALRAQCQVPSSAPDSAVASAEQSASNTQAGSAAGVTQPSAAAQRVFATQPVAQQPSRSDSHGASPRAAAAPSAGSALPAPASEAGAVVTDGPAQAHSAQSARTAARLAVGASYGVARWADGVLSQSVSGLAAYAVHAHPLYVALEIGYAPGLRSQRDGLAVQGTGLRLALLLWGRLPISARLSIDAQLGPAIEWLWLAPDPATADLLSAVRSVSHGDPLLCARVGPALRVYSELRLGVDLGLDVAWLQRSFGFVGANRSVVVFAADRVRPSLTLYARVAL
jgi:hypothetical protein